VEQTAEQIRDVMANLRPPVLDDYGLLAALRWYAGQFSQRTNITITVEGEESVPRLSVRVENALFRIAQEALTNVAKHAKATQVLVKLHTVEDSPKLIVDDDGIGLTPEFSDDPTCNQGWGILTMAERAESISGSFCIESSPYHGTRVIVEVPK
jgi:two-component system sensor histidine kinase UhpB